MAKVKCRKCGEKKNEEKFSLRHTECDDCVYESKIDASIEEYWENYHEGWSEPKC